MTLPKNLITNRTAKLPGDFKKQPAPKASGLKAVKARARVKAAAVIHSIIETAEEIKEAND